MCKGRLSYLDLTILSDEGVRESLRILDQDMVDSDQQLLASGASTSGSAIGCRNLLASKCSLSHQRGRHSSAPLLFY